MSRLQSSIDIINGLDTIEQTGFAGLMILLSLMITRFGVVRPWRNLIVRSAAKWDDALLRPMSARLYVFVFTIGLHLSVNWITENSEDVPDDLGPLFSATYILLATTILSTGIKHLLPVILNRFSDQSSVTVSGSNPLITYFLRAVVLFFGVNLALSELKIELLGILASLAVFSLIIGLAVQQTLGNIVNSFMLAVDRPFEVGDRIEVEGMLGTVVSMGILSTKVMDRDEKLIVIPNNTLISSTLVNHARGGGDGFARRISVVIDIGVDYRESIDHVKLTVLKLARDCPYTIDNPEPRVLLTELGDFAKLFRLYAWVQDYSEEWVTRDWLLKAVDERFGAEDIRIPYPTVVELRGDDEDVTAAEERLKATRQRAAKSQMSREDRKLRKEREAAREELEGIQESLREPEMAKAERADLEARALELSKMLTMFDTDDV
ncbi:MAG: mechanosensitive ion channel family protein [Euryarchaeota archaeon]